MIGRSRPVVDHIDVVTGHAITLRNVTRTEFTDRGDPNRPSRRIRESPPVMPRHPIRQPFRVVLEIEVMLHGNLRNGRPVAQESIRGYEEVRTDLVQDAWHTVVEPPIDEKGAARRRPDPMALHIGSGEQVQRRPAVKQQVEAMLRMGRDHALHGLQGKPADAVQFPRHDEPRVDHHHRHAAKLRLAPSES